MFLVIDTHARQSAQHEERIWQHLWEMRDLAPVSLVLPTVVSSPCPLLAEENADAILTSGMQVPQDSAWVPLHVNLCRFLDRRGEVRLPALETELYACVDRGEALHDTRGWPSANMQFDSWLNRRLAIAVRGWGDLVERRGADPRAFRTLHELEELAEFISTTLQSRSRSLARKKGHCPAVDMAGANISGSGHEMMLRWQRAVNNNALRHRNLVTMSVWDVFPQCQPADFRYIDLLPVLRCANCVSFRRDVDVSHWSINEYRSFHERASAVLRRSIDAGRIAKQV